MAHDVRDRKMTGRRYLVRFVYAAAVIFVLTGCGASVSSSSSNSTQTVQKDILLSWNPNPDLVAGYIVYYGSDEATATTTASVLSVSDAQFDASSPSMVYNFQTDLNMDVGASVCFRIRAYNDAGDLSDWSQAICNA